MRLKVSSAKWRPFCLGLNVLIRMDWAMHKWHNSMDNALELHLFCTKFLTWMFDIAYWTMMNIGLSPPPPTTPTYHPHPLNDHPHDPKSSSWWSAVPPKLTNITTVIFSELIDNIATKNTETWYQQHIPLAAPTWLSILLSASLLSPWFDPSIISKVTDNKHQDGHTANKTRLTIWLVSGYKLFWDEIRYDDLTHWGWVMHICIGNICHHWFR